MNAQGEVFSGCAMRPAGPRTLPRRLPGCRGRGSLTATSLHMTASVTMRMGRSTSCVSWRPDPRHGAEPREPSYADWTRPQRRAAAPLPLLDASRLRCGSACPRTDPSARYFNGLGRTPNVCTRMSSRLQKLSTVPLYELDAVMCTDPGGQQPAGRTVGDGGAGPAHPDGRREGPGSVGPGRPCGAWRRAR